MRALLGLILAVASLGMVLGCGPRLSEEDLGTVVFEVPKVPGSEELYELPGPAAKADSDSKTAPEADS